MLSEDDQLVVDGLWVTPGGWCQPAADLIVALSARIDELERNTPDAPHPRLADGECHANWDIDLTGLPKTEAHLMTPGSTDWFAGIRIDFEDLHSEKEETTLDR